jgi:hypothetical protein
MGSHTAFSKNTHKFYAYYESTFTLEKGVGQACGAVYTLNSVQT